MENKHNYHLKIISREGTIFDGDIESLTSYNEKGKFDILPLHANFISLISKKLIIRLSNKDVREMDLGTALLRHKSGELEIYLGIEEFTQGKTDYTLHSAQTP